MAQVVADYSEAWNETDDGRRLALLERSIAADVVYVDPDVRIEGRENLCSHISAFVASYQGHRLELTSDVDAHHDVLRFGWAVVRPDGSVLSTGLDACLLAADGSLKLILGFFGP